MLTDKKKASNNRYFDKCDSIQIRPKLHKGQAIRAAAVAAGQSVQAYILQAVRERMERDGRADLAAELERDTPAPTQDKP